MEARPGVGKDRCAYPRLEGQCRICTPPTVSHWTDTPEDISAGGHSNSDHSCLAHTAMVCNHNVNVGRLPPTTAKRTQHSSAFTELQDANAEQYPSASRMEAIRQQLSAREISHEATDLILRAWR